MDELYPEAKGDAVAAIDSLIQIVKSTELRLYDKIRWGEDPLESLDGNESHIPVTLRGYYLLADVSLVGETITLAMRTNQSH